MSNFTNRWLVWGNNSTLDGLRQRIVGTQGNNLKLDDGTWVSLSLRGSEFFIEGVDRIEDPLDTMNVDITNKVNENVDNHYNSHRRSSYDTGNSSDLATYNPFTDQYKLEDVFNIEREMLGEPISDEPRINFNGPPSFQSSTSSKKNQIQNDPVLTLLQKAKFQDVSLDISLEIKLPSERLLMVAIEDFGTDISSLAEYLLTVMSNDDKVNVFKQIVSSYLQYEEPTENVSNSDID